MRLLLLLVTFVLAGGPALAQVDVESRRTAQFQTGFALAGGPERISPLAYFWFNQNNFPWKGTALRVITAGVFVDSELGWFLPSHPQTAFGGGLAGRFLVDRTAPYVDGGLRAHQQFDSGLASARLFVNREITQVKIGDEGALPLNVRATYEFFRFFFRRASDTHAFVIPADSDLERILGELRLGGIEPGLTSRQGLEVYVAAEAGSRSGFRAFGPLDDPYPDHNRYRRLLVSLSAKIPIGPNTYFARFAGGFGKDLDELTAWRIGGNPVGFETYLYPVHGYYTAEFLAEEFGIANLEWRHELGGDRHFSLRLYADYARISAVPPSDARWHGWSGVGAGLSCRLPGGIESLLSYGYGINALRNGSRGGHEIALALEKSF